MKHLRKENFFLKEQLMLKNAIKVKTENVSYVNLVDDQKEKKHSSQKVRKVRRSKKKDKNSRTSKSTMEKRNPSREANVS